MGITLTHFLSLMMGCSFLDSIYSFLPPSLSSSINRMRELFCELETVNTNLRREFPDCWIVNAKVVAYAADQILYKLEQLLLGKDAAMASNLPGQKKKLEEVGSSSFSGFATEGFYTSFPSSSEIDDEINWIIQILEELLVSGEIKIGYSGVLAHINPGLSEQEVGELLSSNPSQPWSEKYKTLMKQSVLSDGPESVDSFFDTIYNRRLSHASPFTLITSLHLSGLSDFVELPGLPVLHTWRISGCERLNAVSICEKLSAVEALEISCCPELTSLTGLNKLLSLRSLSLSFCSNLQFDLHVQLPPLLEYLDLTYCPSLEEWCKNSGLQNWKLDETIESFQRSSPVGDSPVYGRENEKNSILEFLLSDDFNRSNLTVVCIVGDSGIGKTSIVQLIYNEERVLDSFDARMFITMPEKSDETRLIKKLIESVTSSPCSMTEADLLEELLIDELSGTKVFVVLDDAENENPYFWNRIVTILNHSTRGSVLLVTTKSKDVAEVIGAMQTYYLDPLSDYYCWKIFWRHIFTGLNINANTDLVETGKQLVSKCQHNPLCIKVLTGLLVCLKNEESWVEILKTDLWNMDGFDGDTLPTLRVGYELLPNDLKKCLQYCSFFPKDYVFAKQQIVRMWMSQGFIISVEGRQPEEVGIQNFDELLLRGFFQQSPLHDVEEEKYIMHDLIRALATHFSRNEFSPAEDALERTHENCFHFSLNPSKIQIDKMEPLIKKASDLQSFLALSRFSLQTRIDISILDITSLSDLFTKCINLRTLDLSCTDIVELPSSIGMLKRLRYLCVNDTKIRSIPRALCSLVSLQTLEAKDCQHLVELPESMTELMNLRHLDVSKKLGCVKMMIGIGQLTNLQSLASFCVGCEIPYCSIQELKDLNRLSGRLQIAGLENIRNGLDAKEAALHNKVHINTLCLHWKDNRICTESEESLAMSEKVLNNLKPNPKIGELIIRNYIGNLFPTWMGDPSFSKLVSIILDKCLNCSQFPELGGLPSLRHLSVQKLYHLVRLENTDNQFVSKNTPKFPSLETLNLWEMYDLEELFETSDRDFPCLRTLSISRCPMLKRVPCFSSLLNLSLYCCVKLPYLPDFPSLESLSIDGFQKMKSFELPKDLPALKKLEIRHCNELLLVEGLPELSLEKLNVVHCPKFDSPIGWKLCQPEPIRTTRWFFPKEGSTTQMEHEETSEPSGEDTNDKQPKADKQQKLDKLNLFLLSCMSALILFFWFWTTPKMLSNYLTELLTLLLGYAIPAFKCVQIIKQRPCRIDQLRFWYQYWIIVAIVMIVETVVVFVQWIPLYGELKLASFVYLWYRKTKGTDVVYDTFLRPYVMQYEPDREQRLSYLRANAGKLIAFYIKIFADKAVTVFLESINYLVSQTNKATKKGGFFSFRKKKEEELQSMSEEEEQSMSEVWQTILSARREKNEAGWRQPRPHQNRYDLNAGREKNEAGLRQRRPHKKRYDLSAARVKNEAEWRQRRPLQNRYDDKYNYRYDDLTTEIEEANIGSISAREYLQGSEKRGGCLDANSGGCNTFKTVHDVGDGGVSAT